MLRLDEVSFRGKKFQDIRTALNRAAKAGIRAEWTTFARAPLAVQAQIEAISEEWVADKKVPEMGFTLGSLDELDDPEVRCLLAIDADHTVHAVASWLPVYRNGYVVGWTLDFMRRRGDGFRASIDFLIASAALSLQDEGCEFMSLSGAPLARAPASSVGGGTDANGGLDRMLDWLGAALEPVYGFRSLLAFKAKFKPDYEPMYLLYPGRSRPARDRQRHHPGLPALDQPGPGPHPGAGPAHPPLTQLGSSSRAFPALRTPSAATYLGRGYRERETGVPLQRVEQLSLERRVVHGRVGLPALLVEPIASGHAVLCRLPGGEPHLRDVPQLQVIGRAASAHAGGYPAGIHRVAVDVRPPAGHRGRERGDVQLAVRVGGRPPGRVRPVDSLEVRRAGPVHAAADVHDAGRGRAMSAVRT